MGCFFGCFNGSKDRKRSGKKSLPAAKLHENESIVFCQSRSPKKIILETEVATDNPTPKLRENPEQGALDKVRKKVTFDLNVTSLTVHGDSYNFMEDDVIERNVKEKKSDKQEEDEEEKEQEKGEEKEEKGKADALKSVLDPPSHRYQNYENSDDEGLLEERGNFDEDEEVDFNEDTDSGCGQEEESYDSYFSLPMERQAMPFQEVSSPKPIAEAASEWELVVVCKENVRDRSKYIHSVLNPVENLSQWNEIKVRPTSFKNPNKENINFDCESKAFISSEPTLNYKKNLTTNTDPDLFAKQEITVDASLSNWLISSNNSIIEPQKSTCFLSNLPVSQEEGFILAVPDMEDIRHSSRDLSQGRSPSRNPDEIPTVGTVGGCWSSKSKEDSRSSWGSSVSEKRGILNTASKYQEDEMESLYCTLFETRLERALELESTETCCNVESIT